MSRRKRVLLVCGYFDWFSGYQEIALAEGFAKFADTMVLAGDRVSPIFSDSHLESIGIGRRYRTGNTIERGVGITRLKTTEVRSMLWAQGISREVDRLNPDLVVQIMPGQLFPALAKYAKFPGPRAVLYGDNSAMWANLSPTAAKIKWSIFAATKGLLYKSTNKNATAIFGYTPETTQRLRPFGGGHRHETLPLAFSSDTFRFSSSVRSSARSKYGIAEHEIVVLAAGKIQKQKRLDLLARAVSEHIECGVPSKLLIAGGDSSAFSRESIYRARSLPHMATNIIETGFLSASSLNEAFNAADVGVWPLMPAITIQQSMGTGLYAVLPQNDLVGHLLRPGSGEYFDATTDIVSQIQSRLPHFVESNRERGERAETNQWLGSDQVARWLYSSLIENPE